MLQNAKARARIVSDWQEYLVGVTVIDCLCLGFGYKSKMALIEQRDAKILKC